jgi:hypothetical protein
MVKTEFMIKEEYVQGDPIEGNISIFPSNAGSDEKSVSAKVGRYDSLNLYEVTEEELNILEEGDNSLELNFAIALGSAALTMIVSICTTTMELLTKCIFVICTIVFVLLGLYFIFKWMITKGRVETIYHKIRDRLKK